MYNLKKIFIINLLCYLIMNLTALAGQCYQTALITFPDYQRNWRQVHFERLYGETLSQWLPAYANKNDWQESVVFHSYNWAKGNSCSKFMTNLLNNIQVQNKTMKTQIIKNDYVDSVAVWCVDKTDNMPAQCEILRVTTGHEGIVSIHYINKYPRQYFLDYQKETWLNIIRNIRIYYSYFRWDKVTGKETSVQLQ